ncbi:uncharacterized protein LOC144157784 [Haemaphysalis longicornis]
MAPINLQATKDLLLLYADLVDEEKQRSVLHKDQMVLNFLVYVLQETTDEIVLLSLKVLAALCADDNRCTVVSKTCGLAPSLETLSTEPGSLAIREAALRLKMRLLEAKVALIARQQEEAAVADHQPPRREPGSNVWQDADAAHSPPPCPSLLGPHNATAKVVSLHIDGLCSQSDKQLCEEKLLGVRGVISFTFDVARRRCVVRVKSDLSPKVLVQAIKSTGTMSAMQVANRPPRSPGTAAASSDTEPGGADSGTAEKMDAKENLPPYLPEEDEIIRDDAVVRHKNSKNSSAVGWIGSAAAFIAKSLYW